MPTTAPDVDPANYTIGAWHIDGQRRLIVALLDRHQITTGTRYWAHSGAAHGRPVWATCDRDGNPQTSGGNQIHHTRTAWSVLNAAVLAHPQLADIAHWYGIEGAEPAGALVALTRSLREQLDDLRDQWRRHDCGQRDSLDMS